MHRNLKIAVLIILIMVLSRFVAHPLSIPVIDLGALIQRVSILAEEIAQWKSYKTEFEGFYNLFREHHREFAHFWKGFYKGDIDDIRPDLEMIARILESPLYRDIGGLDPWRILFNHADRIGSRFQHLEKRGYQDDNIYDKTNQSPAYREYRKETQRKEEMEIRNIKALLKKYATTRQSEESILKRIQHFDKNIHLHSLGLMEKRPSAETMASQAGKLKAIQTYMKADQLILNLHILSLLRTHVEEIMKERFSQIDATNHIGTLNRSGRGNSEALKKMLRGKR